MTRPTQPVTSSLLWDGVDPVSAAADPDQPAEPPAANGNASRGDSPADAALAIDAVAHGGAGDDALAHWLASQLTRVARRAGIAAGQITLAVVGDEQMAELHQQYKATAGTTDVLTFDLRDEPAGPVEGDIVICLDEARRQARGRGHDARRELLLYAVHGLLHLVGFDDHDADDAARMHRREDELLTAAGFGPVYADHTSRNMIDQEPDLHQP